MLVKKLKEAFSEFTMDKTLLYKDGLEPIEIPKLLGFIELNDGTTCFSNVQVVYCQESYKKLMMTYQQDHN